MELEQTVQRAYEAKQILSSPVFIEMVGKLRSNYTNDLIKSAESESEKRERLYLKLVVLDDIESQMSIIGESGYKAEHDLKVRKARKGAMK